MIERIKTEKELKDLINNWNKNSNYHIFQLKLSKYDIQKWIDEGKFKKLKDEINIYYNVRFGCLQDEDICKYYFIGNREALIRISSFIKYLLCDDKVAHIANLKPHWLHNKAPIDSQGSYNYCPLFS